MITIAVLQLTITLEKEKPASIREKKVVTVWMGIVNVPRVWPTDVEELLVLISIYYNYNVSTHKLGMAEKPIFTGKLL